MQQAVYIGKNGIPVCVAPIWEPHKPESRIHLHSTDTLNNADVSWLMVLFPLYL